MYPCCPFNALVLEFRHCTCSRQYKHEMSKYIKGGSSSKKLTTKMGFEPTRAEPNGLAVHRLNHSATSSTTRAITVSFKNLNILLFSSCLLMTMVEYFKYDITDW